VYSFGAFELDARSGELRKHGIRIKLQDQPRQILLLLLEQPRDIATREQIQKRLWPEDTFVDFDNAINSAVRKLRDALGDSAENPRFVETLARRGYRFVAPVSIPADPALQPETLSPAADAKRGRWPTVAAFAILALGSALGAWVLVSRNPADPAELRATPLTANTALEIHPSFSPDGTRVAYSSGRDDGEHFAVFVKLIGPGDPVQITKDQARDLSPAWSPDGRWIALLRDMGREAAILLIPASGGQPRELARVIKMRGGENCGQRQIICGVGFRGSLLAWSPDGKYLFTSGLPEPAPALTVMRISMETGEQQPVTSPPPGSGGDVGAAVSPDGRALAFIRLSGLAAGDIYVASLSGGIAGQPRRVTTDGADLSAPTWTPDGGELIFSSDRGGRRELWRIAASGSAKPARVAGIGENASDAAISPLGRRLVYGRVGYSGSLWRIPVKTGEASEPVRVMASTASVLYPHYSPDGTRIAFQSARLGVNEIWLCDADGSNSVQLTAFGRGFSGSPRWSPDGRTIAFDSNVTGNWDIYTIAAQGGRPIRVTTNQASDAIPNWSRDGRWIYFSSLRTGRPEVWKIHPDGTEETQVTTTGGWVAAESADRKFLYYKYPSTDNADVWRMPVGGGPITKVLEGVRGRLVTVTEHGIYFPAGNPVLELRYFDFASHSIRAIAPLGDWPYATVSSDEQSALYTRNVLLGANLVVVENFR
jgi:Tol biopolymer transport system component/DNA-binding winged helix-turn-helix (wHTH) protein